jgi:hypothetical protein
MTIIEFAYLAARFGASWRHYYYSTILDGYLHMARFSFPIWGIILAVACISQGQCTASFGPSTAFYIDLHILRRYPA